VILATQGIFFVSNVKQGSGGGLVWRFQESEGRWRKGRYMKLAEENEGRLLGERKKLNS